MPTEQILEVKTFYGKDGMKFYYLPHNGDELKEVTVGNIDVLSNCDYMPSFSDKGSCVQISANGIVADNICGGVLTDVDTKNICNSVDAVDIDINEFEKLLGV